MRAADILRTAGLIAAPNLLTVAGSLVVDGSETVNGPLAVHGTAAFDGATTIGGNAAITGTLSLPAGIINNDALANPIEPLAVHMDAFGFALTVANATQASATVTVPSGFTKALVFAGAQMSAVNSTAVVDQAYTNPVIAGVSYAGWQSTTSVSPGQIGNVTSLASKLLTGLSGSFTLGVVVSTANAGWAANGANTCNMDATVLFVH